MKIDILVSSLKGGGAERVAVNLADGWSTVGHDVRILIQSGLDEVEYCPKPEVILESFRAKWRIARALRLRQMLDARRADVVVAVQSNMAIVAGIVAIGLNLKLIGCEHNIPKKAVWGKHWAALRPLSYRQISAVTVLTERARAELSMICPKVRIEVVPNALYLPLSDNEPRLDPADVLPSDAPLLLAAGRLVEAKGFDRMIACFAKLSQLFPTARLVILGDGALRKNLETQISDLGLSDKALLPGRAGNIAEWYRRADLFLMTSRWEGQPMVLMEAMGHGLPAVVTDFNGGPRDIIRHGIDGIILPDDLPEHDPDLWARTVTDLLCDAKTRRALGANATSVLSRFSEIKVAQMWEDLFKSV
jgi:glycosyltransferase involved in cell wall biosynthesis